MEELARSLATEDGELPEDGELGTVLDAASGLTRYEAEAAFRIHKTDLRIRPIWHQREDRVRAHILVCFLAYAMWTRRRHSCSDSDSGSPIDSDSRHFLSKCSADFGANRPPFDL